jgi:hypothetical protein
VLQLLLLGRRLRVKSKTFLRWYRHSQRVAYVERILADTRSDLKHAAALKLFYTVRARLLRLLAQALRRWVRFNTSSDLDMLLASGRLSAKHFSAASLWQRLRAWSARRSAHAFLQWTAHTIRVAASESLFSSMTASQEQLERWAFALFRHVANRLLVRQLSSRFRQWAHHSLWSKADAARRGDALQLMLRSEKAAVDKIAALSRHRSLRALRARWGRWVRFCHDARVREMSQNQHQRMKDCVVSGGPGRGC